MGNLILQRISKGFKELSKNNTHNQPTEYQKQVAQFEQDLMQILSNLQSSASEEIEQHQALVNEVLTAIQNHLNQKASASSSQTDKVEALEQLLLPICRLVHIEENNGNPEEQAWKLAVTFPNVEATMSYLSRRLDTSKEKDTRPVLHDACLYALPATASRKQISYWDSLSKWQHLAKDNMDVPEFRELLAHAPDIELLIDNEAKMAWQEAKQNNPKAKLGAISENKKDDITEQEKIITALQKKYKEIKNKRIDPNKFGECIELDNNFYDTYSKTLNAAMITLAEKCQGIDFKNATIKMIKAFYAKHKATAEEEFAFFLKQGLTKHNYAKFTALQRVDDDTRIPPITINGQDIGINEYYLRRLNVKNSADAAMAACLGRLSDCCQSLSGEMGEPCAIHGLTSPEGGFYVVCEGDVNNPKLGDKLIAQSWVWRSQSGAMVIDSVESKFDDDSTTNKIRKFYHALSTEILTGEYAIPLISQGANSGISSEIATSTFYANELPTDYDNYRDSRRQKLLASKELLFLLPGKAEQFVAELDNCNEFKAIKFIEHALKEKNEDFLLRFTEKFKESGQAVIETCQKYLDLLENKQNVLTLETINKLHQEVVNVLSISNSKGQNIFHLKATNPEHLKCILDLYPKEQPLDAVKVADKHGQTPLHNRDLNPDSLNIILGLYPKEQRLDALQVADEKGRIPLHRAASTPDSLKIILESLPEIQRLDVVKLADEDDQTLLHRAASTPDSLKIILESLPETQRLAAVKLANENGQTLLHLAGLNPDSLKIILDLYPKEQRLDAIKVPDIRGRNPLYYALSNPESLIIILESLPETQRLAAVKLANENGPTFLHWVGLNPDSIKIILDLFPKEQRLDVVKLADENGQTPLHNTDLNPDSLKIILESLPEIQRLDAIKVPDIRGITPLSYALSNPESLIIILESLPETQRLAAVKLANENGQTLLHWAGLNPDSLKIILDLYPKEQRLDAVKVADKHGRTPLHNTDLNPDSLNIILGLYPKEQRLDALQVADENGRTPLHSAAFTPESLQYILNLYPKEQRFDAIKVPDKQGQVPLYWVFLWPKSLKIILDLYPEEQRLDTIKTVCKDLNWIITCPESVKIILESLPETQRFDAVQMADEDGQTFLHRAVLNRDSLLLTLESLPEIQRLEALMITDKKGDTPLYKAASNPAPLKITLDSLPNTDKLKAIKYLASTSLKPQVQAIVDEVKHSITQKDTLNPHRLFSPSADSKSSSIYQKQQENDEELTHRAPPPPYDEQENDEAPTHRAPPPPYTR